MKQLVSLRIRPSRDGCSFKYYIDYIDENGKRKRISLGHADKRKAERQRIQLERELRMGVVEPESMRLSVFLEDSLSQTRGQVRENTLYEYASSMKNFIKVIGDIDYQKVNHKHGEKFMQACLTIKNSRATAAKKITHLKRLFQLAVDRGQLENNPLKRVRKPKVARQKVHVFFDQECLRLLEVAQTSKIGQPTRWDLLIALALFTGMRRGELLNLTWADIGFDSKIIEVSPKKNTVSTWNWQIKDTERRRLPLTNELISMLAEHQSKQPEGYPYVFIPPARYDYIQNLRKQGKWTDRKGNYPLNNFDRQFRSIKKRAGIKTGSFHDLRRTCLSNWFAHNLKEFDVMRMAGHSSFETTRRFYLAVREDLIDRTRRASQATMKTIFGTHLAHTPSESKKENLPKSQVLANKRLVEHARQDSNLRPTD